MKYPNLEVAECGSVSIQTSVIDHSILGGANQFLREGSILKDDIIPIHITPSYGPPSLCPHDDLPPSKSFNGPESRKPIPLIKKVAVGAKKKPPAVNQPLERLEMLNWCSREELIANDALLSREQSFLLRNATTKQTKYPNGFDKGNYFENLTPVIASNYGRASKINYCGKAGPCKQWDLCSKCAYYKGMDACGMYVGAFTKTRFFFITCSFDGDIPFGATNNIVARTYWEAVNNAFRHLLGIGSIEGAYIVHELKIRSFLPVRVLPHSHIVAAADEFHADLQTELSESIRNYPGIKLPTSIRVSALTERNDLWRTLKYQTKAIELQEPYLTAWRTKIGDHRENATTLNLEMKDFLDSYAACRSNFSRIVRMGNLHSCKKGFIGTTIKSVKQARRKKRRK